MNTWTQASAVTNSGAGTYISEYYLLAPNTTPIVLYAQAGGGGDNSLWAVSGEFPAPRGRL